MKERYTENYLITAELSPHKIGPQQKFWWAHRNNKERNAWSEILFDHQWYLNPDPCRLATYWCNDIINCAQID